jgi:mannosyl-3-phosphoglycerate phosphatase
MPSTTTTPKLVIFTDLDGTLLDRDTYSFEPAKPALDLIKRKGVPLVLSSSKTRAEIELYRKKMENAHPFISENGGAVFVPKDYFSFSFPYDMELEEYLIIELGHAYSQLVEILNSIKKETGIQIRGFSDLSEEELVSLCGLSWDEVRFAKKREYDEPFMVEGGEKEIEIVKRKIQMRGVNYAWGGRFHHILGKNDKGKAVEMLKELYENEFFSITAVGIGDSLNDLPMLSMVDYPILLKGKGRFLSLILEKIKNLTLMEGTGPQAWNKAILAVLRELKI